MHNVKILFKDGQEKEVLYFINEEAADQWVDKFFDTFKDLISEITIYKTYDSE